ncbi:MAG: AI-2E family transporter [Patescibacteria group bacterium]|mgnify:FL=1
MNTDKGRAYFLLALLVGSVIVAFLVLQPFLTTIALAGIFAVILHPLYERIHHRIPNYPGLSALATVIVGLLLVIVPLSLIGTLVINQSRTAYTELVSGDSLATAEVIAHNVGSWLEPYVPGATEYANSISLEISTYAEQGLQWLISRIGVAFTSLLAVFLRLLIMLMALYYFLKEGKQLEKLLIERSPLLNEEGSAIMDQLARTITSVVKGSLAIACIQGALAGVGYLIFGLPNPALWGVSTAISALIPGVGTALTLIPAIIYLFAVGHIGSGIGLLLWGMLLVGAIDNFLAPKLIGTGAALHPLAILLSVLGGIALYGPVGVFLGPLTISFLYSVYTVYAKSVAAH